jgi:hypothetical protein
MTFQPSWRLDFYIPCFHLSCFKVCVPEICSVLTRMRRFVGRQWQPSGISLLRDTQASDQHVRAQAHTAGCQPHRHESHDVGKHHGRQPSSPHWLGFHPPSVGGRAGPANLKLEFVNQSVDSLLHWSGESESYSSSGDTTETQNVVVLRS